MPKNQAPFSGKKVKRCLYRTASKGLTNADVNGSLNIMKKEVPNVFSPKKRSKASPFKGIKRINFIISIKMVQPEVLITDN